MKDTKVRQIMTCGDGCHIAQYLKVLPNGDVRIGKSKYRLWNLLFGEEHTIELVSLIYRLLDLFSAGEIVSDPKSVQEGKYLGMLNEIVINLRRKEHDRAIRDLLIFFFIGYKFYDELIEEISQQDPTILTKSKEEQRFFLVLRFADGLGTVEMCKNNYTLL